MFKPNQDGAIYPTYWQFCRDTGRDTGLPEPDGHQYLPDPDVGAVDPEWQFCRWVKNDSGAWEFVKIDRPLRARIDPVTSVVIELHETGFVLDSIAALDKLVDDQREVYFLWEENGYDVPVTIRPDIRVGWLRSRATGEFSPPEGFEAFTKAKRSRTMVSSWATEASLRRLGILTKVNTAVSGLVKTENGVNAASKWTKSREYRVGAAFMNKVRVAAGITKPDWDKMIDLAISIEKEED